MEPDTKDLLLSRLHPDSHTEEVIVEDWGIAQTPSPYALKKIVHLQGAGSESNLPRCSDEMFSEIQYAPINLDPSTAMVFFEVIDTRSLA